MALLSKILALAAVAAALPTNEYAYVFWAITSEYGLNSSPIIGGNFTISNITMLSVSDPQHKNRIGDTQQVTPIQDGDSSGAQFGFHIQPQILPYRAPNITIAGTLVLESSAYESSLTTATFPELAVSIDTVLDPNSMSLGGRNCRPNGEPSEVVCEGTDNYGISISATFHQTAIPNLFEIVGIQYNAH